jgi:hypothetical protein
MPPSWQLKIKIKPFALLNWESAVKIDMQVNQLSAEQLKAVIRFAAEHGRTWKSQLNDAWMTGNYVGFVGSHLLQQVRNQFGPEWLVKFNLKKALAAQDDDESENDGPCGPYRGCRD